MKSDYVIVTGGSGLLGSEIVGKFLALGRLVISLDLQSPKVASPNLEYFYCDITKLDSVLKVMNQIEGKVSNIVHCAAIDPKVTSANTTATSFDKQKFDSLNLEFDVSIRGGLNVIQSCLSIMNPELSVHKSIVLIGSDLTVISPDQRIYQDPSGRQSFIKPISYSIIKHGIVGMTKYLSTILADRDIHVNCLSPGPVLDRQPEELVRRLINRIPMGRLATVEELANVVAYLCTRESRYITGQNIVVDGGRTIW